jgi:hypothetical protein
MPAKSETFLLKFNFIDPDTGDTVEREGATISYPTDVLGFDEILTAKSDPLRGDGWFGRADGLHTVQYNLAGLNATIKIQATLAIEPENEDWFTVYESAYELESTPGVVEKANEFVNFIGNYVFVRIVVENWSGGTINSIFFNH